MKKFLNILLFIPLLALSQSQDQNYIKSTSYKQPTVSPISDPSPSQANVNIGYFDGLGKPIQQIAYKQSSTGKDIISHIEYDEFGRQIKDYLPFVNQSPSKNYDANAQTNLLSYYSSSINPSFETTNTPFSEKIYEPSPLNRLLKQAAPGEDWKKDSGHEIKFEYNLNSSADQVYSFIANRTLNAQNIYNYTISYTGYYSPNSIYKNVTKDENWTTGKVNTTEEYKDNLGRVILKRTYDIINFTEAKHDTYYIYDKIGNLIFVSPPVATDNLVQVQSNQIPYVYNQSHNFSEFLLDTNGNPITSGGGGMSISIQNSSIKLNISAGWSGLATIDLTKQFEINAISPIPDMTLGYLDFYYGGNNQYVVKIVNNKLFFEDFTPNDPPFQFSNNYSRILTNPLNSSLFGTTTTYTSTVTFSEIENLGYQYKYDQRNRLVEKKLPGKQWEFIIYDKLDRPVAIGPVNTPFGGSTMGWLITQYDVFSRVIQTGWKQMTVSATTRNTNQQSINGGANPFNLGTNDILTKNYYDNYAFPDAPTIPTSLPTCNLPIASNVKGMPTGSWVKVLDLSNSNAYELSYTIYDNKYRPVKSYTKNYLGGYTQIESNIDWAGKTLYTLTKHKRTIADEEITVKDMFSYSDQDRLLIHKQKINSLPEQLITSNTYDELGQLISKKVGGEDVSGGTGLQKVDYSYNIRGWLKSINDINDITTENDLFAFKLSYNDPETGQPLFNGNISESFWNTGAGNTIRKYNYTYDKLNRLLQADYSKQGNVTFNSYLEYLTYDKNGNIQTLIRNGGNDTDGFSSVNMIDNLIYTYHPTIKNQLMKVFDDTNSPQGFKDDSDGTSDLVDDYNYDSNGNMTKDDNKGITEIIYNHLNLPTKITFGTNGNIEYLYNAIGQKIRKKVNVLGSTSTDYLNGFQYKDNILKFFPHAEGYVNATESGAVFGGGTTYNYNYVFNYTDHLGNVRLSYGFDPATDQVKIIEQNHYYPFGLKHTNYNSDYLMYSKINESVKLKKPGPTQQVALAYQYKYQGQERQDELGLNWDSFKWRNYDYALGRFMSVDKLAEDYSQQSPYAFAENRVVDGREMEGLEWTSSTSSDGKTVNLNLNVRTVNNSNGIITNKQMGEISTQRAEQLNSSLGGVDSQGRTVNVSVTYSDKATVSWEYSMGNDTNGKTYSGSKAYDNEFGDQFADGLTHEIGNTQVNRTQVNVYQTGDKGVTLDVNTPEMTKTFAKRGAHEDGHVVGLRHEVGDVDNKLKDEQRKDPKNLMNEAPKGTNILPSQRSQVIDLIEKQQKK